jgi:hypothetical protein
MDVNRLISGEHGFFAVLATKRPHGSALQDGLPKDIISLRRRLRLTAPPLTLSHSHGPIHDLSSMHPMPT